MVYITFIGLPFTEKIISPLGTEFQMTPYEQQSLSDRDLRTLKEFVENSLRKSGSLLMEMYGKGNKSTKFDDELVTLADNAAWKMISGKIHDSFDGHCFLRELTADQMSSDDCPRFLWILDTLDGAASFQAGMPVWGVSAALFELFWPVLGFLYLPVTNELYSAYADREALLNDQPIHVRQDPTVDNESLILVYSRFHRDFVSDFPGKIRNFGSSAGHLAYVARGAADACILKNVSIPDLAAGSIILEAAGGQIKFLDGTDFHVGEYLDGKRIDQPLIAAPRNSHALFVRHLKEI
jgi:myo-inositol-1(or 4)-monophosphatase